jgi:hypothetical protein
MSTAWRPSKRQLETLAECSAARLDTARTASLLGISEPVFLAWTKRLAAGAVEGERILMAEFLAWKSGIAHELAKASALGGGLT